MGPHGSKWHKNTIILHISSRFISWRPSRSAKSTFKIRMSNLGKQKAPAGTPTHMDRTCKNQNWSDPRALSVRATRRRTDRSLRIAHSEQIGPAGPPFPGGLYPGSRILVPARPASLPRILEDARNRLHLSLIHI